jgi:hypothetical protein
MHRELTLGNRLTRLLGTCLPAALMAGCAVTGPSERVVLMDVAAEPVACVGVGPQQCLRVREHPDTGWTLFYSGIEGFSHERGFEYTLRVAVRAVIDPPADGSSSAYRLVAVLRKEAVP